MEANDLIINNRVRVVISELKRLGKIRSESELAEMLNVSRSTISEIVNDKRGVSRSIQSALCYFFKVNDAYLREGIFPVIEEDRKELFTTYKSKDEQANTINKNASYLERATDFDKRTFTPVDTNSSKFKAHDPYTKSLILEIAESEKRIFYLEKIRKHQFDLLAIKEQLISDLDDEADSLKSEIKLLRSIIADYKPKNT